MTTLTITVDDGTEAWLQKLSASDGADMNHVAARLLRRAALAARPRPVYDIDALKAAYTEEFAAEDLALSEATVAEHAQLLAEEDAAGSAVKSGWWILARQPARSRRASAPPSSSRTTA